MSVSYRWTYAGLQAKKRRSAGSHEMPALTRTVPRRAARIPSRKLHLAARRGQGTATLAGHAGRWAVIAALAVVSFAAVSKAPLARGAILGRATQWWEAWGRELGCSSAAVPAPKPVSSWPEERTAMRRPAKPLAWMADQGLFWLDSEGKVWPQEHAAPAAHGDYPVITGVQVREIPGAGGVELQTRLDLGCVRSLLSRGWSARISEIHFESADAWVLYTQVGGKIFLRQGPGWARDLQRLDAVWNDLEKKHLTAAAIDLRYANQVIVRTQ